jgi:hypothetical protein
VRPLRLPRPLLAPAVIAVGLLAGCGSDGDEQVAVVSTTTTSEAPAPNVPAGDTPAAADPAGRDAGEGRPPGDRVPPGECAELAEAADGRYVVSDAGEVVVRRQGDDLVLEEVRAAEGWRFEGDRKGKKDDEIEVTFRREGRKVEFEAELDDGDLEIEVCDKD